MFKAIGEFITGAQKWILLILVVLVLILSGALVWALSANKSNKHEAIKWENNFNNADFKLDSIFNVNEELVVVVDEMEFSHKELKKYNKGLYDEIANLEVKLKKAKTATRIEIEYVYVQDTNDVFMIERLPDSVFLARMETEHVSITERIGLTFDEENTPSLSIDSLSMKVNDNILLAHEEETKGWWFWKKITGVKLYIKSDNPYFVLDRVETIQFTKKR